MREHRVVSDLWDDRMRRRVSGWQEQLYGRLAEDLGLGWDPREAYERLSVGPIPAELFSADRFREMRGPQLLPDSQIPEYEAIVKAFLERYTAGAPTPYEEPGLFVVLCELADLVRDKLNETEWGAPEFAIGTLPSGRIHARTQRVGGDSPPVILVEQGLMLYFHAFALCVGAALPLEFELDGTYVADVRPLDPGREGREAARSGLGAALGAYIVDGAMKLGPRIRLSHATETAAMWFLRPMELFVVAHEVAHVFYRHLRRGRQAPDRAERWRQELDCDAVGASVTVAILEPALPRGLVLGACALALHALEFVERTVYLLGGPAPTDEYPPLAERRRRLVTHDFEVLSEAGRAAEIPEIRAWLARFDELCTRVWGELEPLWRERHAQGVRPSPRWSDTIR
jgi:hypothetical protein